MHILDTIKTTTIALTTEWKEFDLTGISSHEKILISFQGDHTSLVTLAASEEVGAPYETFDANERSSYGPVRAQGCLTRIKAVSVTSCTVTIHRVQT